MRLEQIKNVCVVGAGLMGHGIGLTYALGGYRVILNDINDEILSIATRRIRDNLEILAENAVIVWGSVDEVLSHIKVTSDIEEAVRDADFITEAVSENVEVKRDIFNRLDTFCPRHTILASNTSSLSLKDFAAGIRRKDRTLITHWFNPPHIVPVVEVVRGEDTSDEVFEVVYALLKKVKKIPVKIHKEIPGFIVNRIQMGMIREVWSLWEQGIASPEDIDLAVKGSFGFRMAAIGPLETCDLGGLDLWYNITERLFKLISSAQKPPEALRRKVESGVLGLKSGRGFFDYTEQGRVDAVKLRDKRFIQLLGLVYPDLWKYEP